MGKPKRSIKISDDLKEFLKKNSVSLNQTYEDVIWMLIGTNTLTKEQKLKAKRKYEECL